jgi:hypothetical protein
MVGGRAEIHRRRIDHITIEIEINALREVSKAVAETAREILVIGQA